MEGGYYEREKQRAKGKQKGATVESQREKKIEEGEEEQVGWQGKIAAADGYWQTCVMQGAL